MKGLIGSDHITSHPVREAEGMVNIEDSLLSWRIKNHLEFHLDILIHCMSQCMLRNEISIINTNDQIL